MRNRGRVDFEPRQDGTHNMTLQMTFIAPRFAASIFRRSSSVARFVEKVMLRTTLMNFRDVVLEHDLGESK